MFYKKESKSIFFVYVTANLNADALCAPKLKFFSRRAAQRAENLKKCEFVVDKCRSLRYNNQRRRETPAQTHGMCGRSSSGRAPPCQGGGSEFEPRRPLHLCGSLAQLGEHLPYKQRVSGSSPIRVASSKVLLFIVQSCKQDCCDERQTFSFSPQTFASQIFAGAPFETGAGGCRDNCTGYASVAQSVEQGTENPRVIGSIPIGGTSNRYRNVPYMRP